MQKTSPRIDGSALIYTMAASALLAAIAGTMLTTMSKAVGSEQLMRDNEAAKDFSDLCERAVIQIITTGLPSTDMAASIAQGSSNWPSTGSFSSSAVGMQSGSECSFQPISYGGSINEDPSTSLSTTYYKVRTIQDKGVVRIQYETIIAINP